MKKRVDQFVAYIEKDENGIFVGSMPSLPGCHTEGDTYEEVVNNLREVTELCLRNMPDVPATTFVGIQNLEIVHG